MKTLLMLALFVIASASGAEQIEVTVKDGIQILNPTPSAQWPRGIIYWRFDGKWPGSKAQALRKLMKTHPEFQESESGVVFMLWHGEKQIAWGLIPGSLGTVSFVTFASDLESWIISCSSEFNASSFRKLNQIKTKAAMELFIPKILNQDPTKR